MLLALTPPPPPLWLMEWLRLPDVFAIFTGEISLGNFHHQGSDFQPHVLFYSVCELKENFLMKLIMTFY